VPDSFAAQELPRMRTGGLLAWLQRQTLWKIAPIGLATYLLVVLVFSCTEFAFHAAGHDLIFDTAGNPVSHFGDAVYFNLVTILTVGYGDLHPGSYGKILAVVEALIGVALFGGFLSVITIKALLAPANTIVFSKYAYYCTEPNRFLIVFVNTSHTRLGNVEISSYFKIGGDWGVKPLITAPFLTQSVQTFYVDKLEREALIARFRDGDCLRVGIAAGLGFTAFSTSIQYSAGDILVIPDRSELVAFFEPLWKPDFKSASFERMFHYRPEKALTLSSFVEAARQIA
jgi:hypothetical protein